MLPNNIGLHGGYTDGQDFFLPRSVWSGSWVDTDQDIDKRGSARLLPDEGFFLLSGQASGPFGGRVG